MLIIIKFYFKPKKAPLDLKKSTIQKNVITSKSNEAKLLLKTEPTCNVYTLLI